MAGYIKIKDIGGKVSIMKLPYVTDLAKLKTFADGLDSYSNGQCIECGVITTTTDTPNATAATHGKLETVENKAALTFYYIENNVKEFIKLVIPAPDDDTFEHVDKVGYRYLSTQGEALAAMLSTLTGKTVKYSTGSMLVKKTQAQL